MHFHSQDIRKDERGFTLLNWRCWLRITEHTSLNFEIHIPGRSGLRFDIQLGQDEDAIQIGLAIPYLFAVYLTLEQWSLHNWLANATKRKDEKYGNGRTIGFYLWHGNLSISLWYDPMESRSSDPKWWHLYYDLRRVFWGRSNYSERVIETREILVPMPEHSYPATSKLFESTWSHPRWFDKKMVRCKIDIPGGIPFKGKGENSWDCGTDATFGITTGKVRDIPEAVGHLVTSVLRDRVRNGGWSDYNWQKVENAQVV